MLTNIASGINQKRYKQDGNQCKPQIGGKHKNHNKEIYAMKKKDNGIFYYDAIGDYDIPIVLHKEVKATIKVKVVSQE